jgi:KilA-N domain
MNTSRDDVGRLNLDDVRRIVKAPDQRSPRLFFRADMGHRMRRESEQRAKRIGRHAPVTSDKAGRTYWADEHLAIAYAMWASPEFALHVISIYQRHNLKVGCEGLGLWELVSTELCALHDLAGVASTSGRHLARFRELKRAQHEVIDGLTREMTPGLFNTDTETNEGSTTS